MVLFPSFLVSYSPITFPFISMYSSSSTSIVMPVFTSLLYMWRYMNLKLHIVAHLLRFTPFLTTHLSTIIWCRFLKVRHHFLPTIHWISSRFLGITCHANILACNGVSLVILLLNSINSSLLKDRLIKDCWKANSTPLSSMTYSGDSI